MKKSELPVKTVRPVDYLSLGEKSGPGAGMRFVTALRLSASSFYEPTIGQKSSQGQGIEPVNEGTPPPVRGKAYLRRA